jgi:hypothetical protein
MSTDDELETRSNQVDVTGSEVDCRYLVAQEIQT